MMDTLLAQHRVGLSQGGGNWSIPLVTLLSATLLYIFLYPNRSIGIPSRNDIPGPRGLPLIGNLLQILLNRRRMIPFMKELGERYGPLCTLTLPGWGRLVVVNHPEWLAHVKKNDITHYTRGRVAVSIFEEFPGKQTPVSTEGSAWRRSRKIIQPIFSIKSFEEHVMEAMNEIVPVVVKLLDQTAEKGLPVDWNDLCGRIALSLFCKSSLNVDTPMLQEDLSCLQYFDPLVTTVGILNDISASRLFNPYWKFTDELDGKARIFRKNIAELQAIVENMIQDRREEMKLADQPLRSDFFSSLVQDPSIEDPIFIRNMMVTLLFGGRDNMQNSLVWACYELCRHPEWLEKMRREALEVGQSGQVLSFSTINLYPVHLAVFHETTRLWPGLPKNARYAIEDDVLPAIPQEGIPEVPIHKNTYVLWSDTLIMQDTKVWGSDAADFNPGRHLSSNGKFIKPPTRDYVAFGAGPRFCPASQLVKYQWVSIWSTLVSTFSFKALDTSQRYGGDSLTNVMSEPYLVYMGRLKADLKL